MFDVNFDGAKIAILRRTQILTLLRDDRPEIAWPNFWDLPGGGREGAETPFETVQREVREETGLYVPEHRVFYHTWADGPQGLPVHFFAALWDGLTDDAISFGDEGQEWRFMDIHEYIERSDVIPSHKTRVRMAMTTI